MIITVLWFIFQHPLVWLVLSVLTLAAGIACLRLA